MAGKGTTLGEQEKEPHCDKDKRKKAFLPPPPPFGREERGREREREIRRIFSLVRGGG
jgi:hypothetical protein